MSHIYDEDLQDMIRQSADHLMIDLKEGVYIQLAGPNFESPAEIQMCKVIGADAVGMSTACCLLYTSKLDMDYKELSEKITVENPTDTRIMQITVSDNDPELAKNITQDLAEVTSKTVAEKMDVKSPTIIENAYKSEQPDSPSLKKNVAIGAILGFILMAAAIVIQYLMNDTILKEDDIEKYLGINTLAQLPLVKGTSKRTKKVKRAR